MTSDQVAKIEDVNTSLRRFLTLLTQSGPLPGPEDLAELLKGVIETGEWIKEASDPGSEAVLGEYRRLLERLRGALPLLEVRLQMERACLERERSEIARASQWSATAKATTSSHSGR